ncbi:hypothetical protein L2Y96_12925 [Luteibacter aegosomaticola]|uniref:hypothetical protein n=1 Tax=Luteibacter aegosomaticola TaxID=2911538 RepID=UPI001FF8A91C|nr:hypothetical protein [Luteibacter aegosomaticola]UPG88324.1 hypothetical protein L2Y96_12925 [Luteibacter aegosomaticola]
MSEPYVQTDPLRKDRELFFIKPIMLGGDAEDPANRVWLTREEHVAAVRYWNGVIESLRGASSTE